MKYLLLMSVLFVSSTFAQGELVHFDDFDRDELQSQAFELNKKQTVKIEVIGVRSRDYNNLDFAWILNLKTREVVWAVDDADDERHEDNRNLSIYTDKIELKEGMYKVYFSTFRNGSYNFKISDIFNFSDRNRNGRRRDIRKYDFKLFTSGKLVNSSDELKPFANKESIVDLTKAKDDKYEKIGFNVKTDTDIYIYALGEVSGRDGYDFTFIKNIETGKKVWALDRRTADHAGGAKKNQDFKGKVSLDKGSYILTFVTDDSHHFDDWNDTPPYDPDAWGVQIFADDKSDIELFDVKGDSEKNMIVSLTRLGDDRYESQAFTLSEDTKIRVYAIGERGHGYYESNDMADFGWIVDNNTRRRVWEMDNSETQHAGGSSKNRLADEVITLKEGSYTVHYSTDDSHSYDDGWNASKPYDGEKWGITLYGFGDDFDNGDVKLIKFEEKNIISQLVKVRNHDSDTKTFTLDEDTDVRIYAIGEGDRSDMVDFGWIKNADTGSRVWRMYYDETSHAGGARKNRVIDEVVRLKKGTYKLYYETDGSHSYRRWNADAPRDQDHYGITVYSAE